MSNKKYCAKESYTNNCSCENERNPDCENCVHFVLAEEVKKIEYSIDCPFCQTHLVSFKFVKYKDEKYLDENSGDFLTCEHYLGSSDGIESDELMDAIYEYETQNPHDELDLEELLNMSLQFVEWEGIIEKDWDNRYSEEYEVYCTPDIKKLIELIKNLKNLEEGKEKEKKDKIKEEQEREQRQWYIDNILMIDSDEHWG